MLRLDPALEDGRVRVAARDRVVQIEARIGLRAVRAPVRAAALGAQQRVAGDEARERVRIVGERSEPLGVAHQAGVAPQRRARLAAGLLEGRRGRRLARLAARLGEGGERGARSEDEALAERVGGQAVGAVQAGARALADRVEAGHRRRAVEVGDDPAHAVVRRRRHRARARSPDRGPPRAARSTTLGNSAGSTARMSRSTLGRPLSSHLRPDRARHLVARRELLDEALAVGVQQGGALAADRLGDQEALAALDAGHGGRVELHELEVGERRAGAAREQQADAQRAGRVGRALPQGGRAAGGEDDRAGVDRAPVLADDADAAPVARPTAWRRGRLR